MLVLSQALGDQGQALVRIRGRRCGFTRNESPLLRPTRGPLDVAQLSEAERRLARQNLNRLYSSAEVAAMGEALKAQAEITISERQ